MDKPNILMIMADQFRADWMSCVGNGFVETPNLNAIAETGVRFTKAICNSPLCAPSRAALAAGKYPHRLGLLDNTVNFPLDQPTYYQALRKAGYRVGVVGKTDLHKPEHFYGRNGDRPFMYHLGFTDVVDTEGKVNAARYGKLEYEKSAVKELAGPYQRYLEGKGVLDSFVADYDFRHEKAPVWYADQSSLCVEDYHDSYIGRKACDFLEDVSDESPWHLFVSFVGPHDPWDAPAEYLKMFNSKSFPDSIKDTMEEKPEWVKKKSSKMSKGLSEEDLLKVKCNYAAMIKLIDDWTGRILSILEKRGLKDNTVIIFCADHGEMMGDHGLFQKSVMYEGALRIPLLISHPQFKASKADDSLVELIDLCPTILDIAGIGFNRDVLDGKSLLQVLKGGTEPHKEYQLSELQNTRMIFDGKYKFIQNYNDIDELYDLENDTKELYNVIKDSPEVKKRLLGALREIRR